MNKPKINIVIMLFSMIFFCATIGLLISMSQVDKLTEETTTILTATVSNIEITNTGNDVFIEIYTKEYDTSLLISRNISNSIKINDMDSLKTGGTIVFGVEKSKAKQIDMVEFINIVSLKTDTRNIFTLNEYNKCMYNAAKPARIVSIIISLFCLFIFLHFFKK